MRNMGHRTRNLKIYVSARAIVVYNCPMFDFGA